ncbi:MAG: 50S ribosomal protein L1 [Candidatus Eremiobacteraeota bacterium]|nr:50S ribosomal protein L1 [Candidatus Eremiobacteraeota bacterium]MBV8461028.1 50S ribosomal protein L1 [Candidatus Eremiobacteraeota bacterium]MBV8669073.1 50S ribosomal protein L1 [Candidatus Eremiobacteraeota bacterium]
MKKHGKKYNESLKVLGEERLKDATRAIEAVKSTAKAKFDETVEVHIRLGIDMKKSEQNVRGTVVLPHGTGKSKRVIVFAKGEKAREAQEAGADVVGDADLIERIKGGWNEFDIAVATPDMMGAVGSSLGKILAQRMPNPKVGTVTQNVKQAVSEIKAGKIEYRPDKAAVIHCIIGKASFTKEALLENFSVLMDAIVRAKPASAKGTYLKSITVATTMGPGVRVDPTRLKTAA